jgi:flagellar biosynthesis protein FlhA
MTDVPQTDSQSIPLLGGKSSHIGRLLAHNDLIFAAGLAMILATLLIPLPTFLLDLLLSCSIGVSLATLVIVLAANESIEFSTFPSLLLFMTLFRLSLNVASTRLILLQGNAGQIIETFGQFVVGGNMVIGLVIFLILVIIQFVVITKGSERISEVAARFNLDAMPGKQMAIDADLNAGLIGEEQARDRREKIVKESEFYGAMDGSSKFIRGDAVAGLIITAINLIGGFVVGMTGGLTAGESVKTYSILAVGDGLVSQIPALIISTSAGFLISKTSTKSNVSQDLLRQALVRPRPIAIASALMGAMVFVPGFPKLPFLILSAGAGVLAHTMHKQQRQIAAHEAQQKAEAEKNAEPPVTELLEIDRLSIQVGGRLIKTVDPRRKGSLSHRISPLRKKFAQQYGVILPLVRLRDNVSLDPYTYEIRINNHAIASGQLQPDMFLAMDPGTVQNPIEGVTAQEPVFNLPALWVPADQKDQAELRGYTVVDPETVLVTHLSEILRKHAYELLTRDDVQQLVDRLRESQPALVNGVVGESVSMALLHRVLQNLLRDGIPVRDLPQILETLGDHAPRSKDPVLLTELARKVLVRTITEQHADAQGRVYAIILEPALEYELSNSLGSEGAGESLALSPERAMDLSQRVSGAWREAMELGREKTVLLCDYKLRPHLSAMLSRQLPELPILAYDEIAPESDVEVVTTIASAHAGEEAGTPG